MLTFKGKYSTAIVMIDEIDETTEEQIRTFINHPAFAGTYIVIMPDCHAGKGAVIGFTSTLNDYIIPNVVGVDIGCGMLGYKLNVSEIDFAKLDKFIRKQIPSGFNIRPRTHKLVGNNKPLVGEITEIVEKLDLVPSRVFDSLGSLGGGNHFIEVDKTEEGDLWLVVHSGSRNFGLQIANYHQKIAKNNLVDRDVKDMLRVLNLTEVIKDAEFLENYEAEEYLEDMKVAQKYAILNRKIMMHVMIEDFFGLKYDAGRTLETVHNYIDFSAGVVRKGAISAQEGEQLIIPFNMQDGIIIGTGKGNSDWNYSAPHGAGRILSRTQAKKQLSVDDFKESMKGVWTSCVSENTLDEAPMAYKDTQVILNAIKDTVDINFWMKPTYNFKADEVKKFKK